MGQSLRESESMGPAAPIGSKRQAGSERPRISATDVVLLATYCGAITTANGLVTAYGQPALLVTAFCVIPFDLVVRDLMQDRWQDQSSWALRLRMAVVILAGSGLSYITTVGSLRVTTASFIAFSLTGLVDALTYQWMIKLGRLFRINTATVIGGMTDTVVFATIAFDHASLELMASQAVMKVAGGAVWSLLLFRLFKGGAKVT